ncbi:MAG: T9SS type A sorting domain-containing protein, partial [candidate division WOR-3 bacterium]|nr:T9SS type A sorting domain-containing protein [candidate division WOR-3 bacterium]
VWEQFDSLNYEPQTNLARADIWIAELRNNGQTVYAKRRITEPNTTSKRFPIVGGIFADTLVVSYLIDSIAGFSELLQGRATNNPIVSHFIPVPFTTPQIKEQLIYSLTRILFDIFPNPFTTQTTINFSLPDCADISLQIYNGVGKLVKTLVDEYKRPGRYSYLFNSSTLTIGVYFFTLKVNNKLIVKKITKAD